MFAWAVYVGVAAGLLVVAWRGAARRRRDSAGWRAVRVVLWTLVCGFALREMTGHLEREILPITIGHAPPAAVLAGSLVWVAVWAVGLRWVLRLARPASPRGGA